MKTRFVSFRRSAPKAVAMTLLVAGSCGVAPAQTGSGFDLSWNTIAGGTISTGGTFKLGAVAGQAASGPVVSGGSFTLQPGFLQDGSYFPVPVTLSIFTME
jgi:hypothetical protein